MILCALINDFIARAAFNYLTFKTFYIKKLKQFCTITLDLAEFTITYNLMMKFMEILIIDFILHIDLLDGKESRLFLISIFLYSFLELDTVLREH